MVDFKLLEVMTLGAQREDQKLQKNSIPDCWEGLFVSFMPNSKNLPCWMCGDVCIESSSCSCRSLDLLHFFRCVPQALSSQITEVNWISENKQNKMCSTLNLLSFCYLSQKLCPLMLTGFLIQKIILLEWY